MLFPDTVGTETAYCGHCGQYYRASEEPDPSIGRCLPGIWGACCGHGDVSKAYIDPDVRSDEVSAPVEERLAVILRSRLTGETALRFLAQHSCGPFASARVVARPD
jgi:hypothetical protein